METFVLIGLWVIALGNFLLVFTHLSEGKPTHAVLNSLGVAVNAGAISLINGWV